MDALLASMSYRDLQEWKAYFQLDPFGGERGDIQAAIVKQAIINTMGRGEGDDPVDLEDCLPRFGESKRAEAKRRKEKDREVADKIRRVLGGLGGK